MSLRASALLLPVIYLGFISLGLPDGTFGVAWPRMHVGLGVPVGLAGTLALVGTLLSAASSFAAGRITARFQTGPVVLVSCVLTGSGLMLVSQAQSMAWLWLAAVPLGLGAGAVDAGLNAYVARHYSGRHMNWLHACWGIGATCGPLLMTQAIAGSAGWRGGFLLLGGIQLSLAVVFLLSLRLWSAVPARTLAASHEHVQIDSLPTTPANSAAGWLSALIFTFYVAVEGTAGLWAGSILVIGRGINQEAAGICVAVYYGLITAGRVLVGFVVDRWGNRRLVTLGLIVAFAGGLLFTQAADPLLAGCALAALGLGFAPVYPCLMHEVPRRFAPQAAMVVIGRQSGAAYFGGAFAPAAAGWLAETASLDGIPWALIGGLLLLAAAIRWLNRIT
ncbi:MAG: MFS transporter [Opitutaceae bacterium]